MKTACTFRETAFLPPILKNALPPRLWDGIRSCGNVQIEELRLHTGRVSRVIGDGLCYAVNVILEESEMAEILKRMCGGSLYAYAQSINQGFVTLEGGIRVGICGHAALDGDRIIGVSNVSGMTVRIPHAVSASVSHVADSFVRGIRPRGMLFYSVPGVGKTTLLRLLAKELSSPHYHLHTVVVDSREEIGPSLTGSTLDVDVLMGYPRSTGIEIAVRSMCAEVILCDEIGSSQDADAILSAANCGVPIIATAHASSVSELLRRPSIRRLHDAMIFGAYVRLTREHGKEMSYQFTDLKEACNLL